MDVEPKVLLIRHGHTKLNGGKTGEDRIRGWKDIPLDEQGLKDAEKVRDELARKYEINCAYSSDLSRAYDTAKIATPKGVGIEKTKDLRPWNLGVFQGQATKIIIEDLNNMVKHEDVEPKDGESFKEFRERFLEKLLEIIDETIAEGLQTAVFTHYRDLKCADAWLKKGAPHDLSIDVKTMIKDDFKPGSILEIPLDMFGAEHDKDDEGDEEE